MTCDTVRERLLRGSTDGFAALEPHLSTCAGCAELAERIRRTETHLRQHVEDFVTDTTLDASWARALELDAGPPRSGFGVNGLVIGLAAAAVLAVAALGGFPGGPGPDGPEPPGETMSLSAGVLPEVARRAAEHRAAFDAIETGSVDVEGLSRKDEDARLRQLLQRKAEALQQAEAAWTEVATLEDPHLQVMAYRELGALYHAMGADLETFVHPSYLTEAQGEAYGGALAEKATVQWEKAAEAWTRGLELARIHGHPDERLLARDLDALRQRLALGEKRAAERATLAAARGVELAPKIEVLVAELEGLVEGCDLDEGSVAELGGVLEQVGLVLEAGQVEMYADVHALLEAYVKGARKACADPG